MASPNELVAMLDKLKATSSTNGKVERLKTFLEDDDFKELVVMALTSTFSYNIKTIPRVAALGPLAGDDRQPNWPKAIKFLKELRLKQGASDQDKLKLGQLAADPDMYDLASRICKKNLKCGVSAKLVNKAVPETVFIMPYQRCSLTDKLKRITYPAVAEVKADGMFINAVMRQNELLYMTRQGNPFPLDNFEIDEALESIAQGEDVVVMGEFRIWRDGAYLSRKVGNGILNSILKGSSGDHGEIRFTVWDCVPYEDFYRGKCEVPLEDRQYSLDNIGKGPIDRIFHKIVHSQDEAFAFAEECIKRGDEGAVLKDFASLWQNHTCPLWIKLKAEKECELEITGWEYAEADSKYDGMMGSVTCQSSCGGLVVNVSGWNDAERAWDWDEHIGKIITVVFNEVIDSDSKDAMSLFLPRAFKKEKGEFVEFRDDKAEADSLEYIMKL